MDNDRLEFRHGMLILAGGCVAYASTFLSEWNLAVAWTELVLCAAGTLLTLRRATFADLSMARRVRLSYAWTFGFVVARLVAPQVEWEWWVPVFFPAAVFAVVMPWFPSGSQRGRLARAFPADGTETAADSHVGRGWWLGYYALAGIETSILFRAFKFWGWPGSIALFFALCVPLIPLRRLAKRREAQTEKPWKADPAAEPLFPA